mmetsp:Transcript_25465/g.51870  ORF Transcript_25465/g.51870 Transcript_25465/m.51870 type:complete len:183 (+) Transcript_25465:178-726(+)
MGQCCSGLEEQAAAPAAVDFKNDGIFKAGENIWISGCEGAKDKDRLKQHGITHILNMVGDGIYDIPLMGGKENCYFPDDFTYKILAADDNPSQNIEKFFVDTSPFILAGAKAGGVLVHCYAGVSRSATCICAFLMATNGLTAEEALAQVRKGRPEAKPNEGFWIQLQNYERTLEERRKGGNV